MEETELLEKVMNQISDSELYSMIQELQELHVEAQEMLKTVETVMKAENAV